MNWRTLTGSRNAAALGHDLPDRPPRPYDATSETWREQRGYSTTYEADTTWTLGELRILGALAELTARPGSSPYAAAMTMFGG